MSNLRLYYLFSETSTLSDSTALLCKATLMTFASYNSTSAVTWCTANIATFGATSFYKGKTLVSYSVTTPLASTATSVITVANTAVLNSTLWDVGFFAKETALAAVIDVENANHNVGVYLGVISAYCFLMAAAVMALYYATRGEIDVNDNVTLYIIPSCHALFSVLTVAMILAYGVVVVTLDNIEAKTPIVLLESIVIVNAIVFSAALFLKRKTF